MLSLKKTLNQILIYLRRFIKSYSTGIWYFGQKHNSGIRIGANQKLLALGVIKEVSEISPVSIKFFKKVIFIKYMLLFCSLSLVLHLNKYLKPRIQLHTIYRKNNLSSNYITIPLLFEQSLMYYIVYLSAII